MGKCWKSLCGGYCSNFVVFPSRLGLANGKPRLTAMATFCCYCGFPRLCCCCVSACICNYASWVLEAAIEIETTTATRQDNKFSREEEIEGKGAAQ